MVKYLAVGLLFTASASLHAASCSVQNRKPSTAETALYREENDIARKAYQEELAANPSSLKARLGLIRVLVQENKLNEALASATDLANKNPDQSIAEEAMGEVLFRNGDIGIASQHIVKALLLDPCNAHAHYDAARYLELSGQFASAHRQLETAYKIDPADETIHQNWIFYLPKSQRISELTAYLETTSSLSEMNRNHFRHGLERLKVSQRSTCTRTNQVEHTSIPISQIMSTTPGQAAGEGLEVLLNKTKRKLQIDTGASGLLLTRAAAKRLHLIPETQGDTAGVGDGKSVDFHTATVESIRIGEVEYQNCIVSILDKNNPIDEVDGLIGLDVFADYAITLDFMKMRLQLEPLPIRPGDKEKPAGLEVLGKDSGQDDGSPVFHDRYVAPEMRDWSPMYRRGHALLIPTRVNGGKERLFIIDTGTSANLLSNAAARDVGKTIAETNVDIVGIGGKTPNVLRSGKTTLEFSGLRQPLDSINSFDFTTLSHDMGSEISGILGMPTLYNLVMHMDYRDNLVKFEYRSH